MDLQDAIEYIKKRLASGELTAEHVAQLVAAFQEFVPEEVMARVLPAGKMLQVDAMPGPQTLAVLAETWKGFAREDDAPPASPPVAALAPPPFAAMLLEVAREEVGNGEEGFDNSGYHIAKYRTLPNPESYRGKNLGGYHHWCCFFLTWCIRQALERMERPLDDARFLLFSDSKFNGRLMPIGGARDLVYRAATSKHGKWIARYGQVRDAFKPGDLVAIRYNADMSERRGPGHVFVIEAVHSTTRVTTIEGNLGKYPSKVKRVERDLAKLGGSARLLQAARLS